MHEPFPIGCTNRNAHGKFVHLAEISVMMIPAGELLCHLLVPARYDIVQIGAGYEAIVVEEVE